MIKSALNKLYINDEILYRGKKKTIIKVDSFDIDGVSYTECEDANGKIDSYPTNELERYDKSLKTYTREEVLSLLEFINDRLPDLYSRYNAVDELEEWFKTQ